MARKIIVLDRLDDPNAGGDYHYRFAFWLAVPTSRQSFYAAMNSAYTSVVIGPDAPTNTETTALRNGTVVEQVYDAYWPNGTSITQIASDLAAMYNIYQTNLNNYNPWGRYGTFWDGTNWTVRNIA